MLRSSLVFVSCLAVMSLCAADEKPRDDNSLAYLDECNPWYPHKDFPKLITPQWVGEEGVEAVIVLAIDDMRDPAKYEQYLRPILNRLKQIDGRAPVSIMTCDVKPDDAQLQSWLGEGLSIECHTIDHPCPILQGGDLPKAKSTYDRCVDLMGTIPGNKPVAFRTPCCDSLNTVSPRFFAEIFDGTTEEGHFLQIDSSVFTFFTSEDESLPKELVLDANGQERFWKYLPKNNKYGGNTHDNFVNYIKNYPYPYVINNSCWEFPCIAPSDWSAQHLHGINNAVTIEDWKAAIDLTVHKQGCFSLVFHPHGWIKPEQVVEMIDHAVAKHGNKVKFLNFREVAERLNHAISHDSALRRTTERSSHFPQNTNSTYRDLPEATIQALATSEATKTWPIFRTDGTYNGFFIQDNHFCWINEDTAKLPDLMYRVSFDEVLAAKKKAEEQDSKSQISNLKSEVSPATYSPVPIGAAVVDITPHYPVRLTGYGNRMKESDGVAAKIHARALVIDVGPACRAGLPPQADPQSAAGSVEPATQSDDALTNESQQAAKSRPAGGTYTVLITVDNCGVPLEMTEAVYERIAAKYNIPRQNFAISSTHSHSAPWLRGFAPNIFAEIPEDHAAHLAQYEEELTDKLVDVVEKAIASQRPGHLSYGFGEAGFAMNRRALANGKWSGFGEVPDGPTDKRVPVLAAHDVDGKLIAVLANYACHCTTETGEFNQISGDWAGFAADMLEVDHPGAVALIAIGCGADANPSPRGTHEQARGHGKTIADEVTRILARGRASALRDNAPDASKTEQEQNAHGGLTPNRSPNALLHRINPDILCNMTRIDLPLGPIPSRETWEQQAKEPGVTGSRARYFLQMLDEGKPIPTTIPDYPVQTWCFGDDLAMVFLGGEVVVDYSIRMNDMFDSDRLWINAYSNDVPCYIASARVLREGGYECDSSMLYYRRPTRLAPEAEDVLCDAVQKIMPHKFYSEKLQQDFPAPKSSEESLKTMTTKPDLRVVLAASEPLIRDPVAFDWDERGRLWVVEMGDYPKGDGYRGRVQMLEDTDKNGVYDKATTFLDNLAFPNGIHCWRGGVIITMAPEIFYAEDTDGDGKADVRETMYRGFVEGNQQHRINGLRWGLDGWLYLANGDSGGEIAGTGYVPGSTSGEPGGVSPRTAEQNDVSQGPGADASRLTEKLSIRGRDLRINPDTNELDAVSGQTQFGRERDDFGNWFGNNNSNPIWQYVLEDRYVRRNPHAGTSQVTAQVAVVPGAAPVYPTSRTLARFNDFAFANRFTSACSTMIYRDNYLGEQYYGNAFTSEPVHNLVSRLVMTRDGYGFKGERAADEQQSEFLASSDNWFRPTMIRTGPDGALWVADMYRAVIEHPEWIPPEYQRKMNLYAGSDMGRIYRIVPASECCGDNVAVSLRRDEPLTAQRDVEKRPAESGKPEVEVGPACRAGLPPQADKAAGDSVAEQRPMVAPGFSSGNDRPDDAQTQDGRQDVAQEHGESTLGEEAKPARLISLERDGYFDQPWNEIPIEALVKRLESPNGWWRDTAQRILVHRLGELSRKDWVPNNWKDILPQSRVQIAAILMKMLSPDDFSVGNLEQYVTWQQLYPVLLSDPDPRVRRFALSLDYWDFRQFIVSDLQGHGVAFPPILSRLKADPDRGVRLQLCLLLGILNFEGGDRILGELLRDNFDDTFIRDAALSSLHPRTATENWTNLSGVLTEALNVDEKDLNEELLAILMRQASAMDLISLIIKPLESQLNDLNTSATTGQLNAIVNVLQESERNSRLGEVMDRSPFPDLLRKVQTIAGSIARDDSTDLQRRTTALRLAVITQGISGEQSLDAADFLTVQTPLPLQLVVVEFIGSSLDELRLEQVAAKWESLAPAVRTAALTKMLQRVPNTERLLDRIESGKISIVDFDAVQRDQLIHHKNDTISSRAKKLFDVSANTARSAVVEDFKSQISNLKFEISGDEQAAPGKLVFEKRCATCHRLQDIGKEVGADLAALKDRSTDALLTAILDPNKAVESKFLVYTVVTKDGLQHSGMLKGETGGSLTLIGNDGKEITVVRADIEELVGSQRSLMPEGLEKDLSATDLAHVIAFVQSTGTPWKRFDGNAPKFVAANADGSVTLPASAAEIYGPSLIFEEKYGNLGYWLSADDYARWAFEVPKSGHWTVEFDFACDDSNAGSLIKFSTGNRMLTARVPGSGTWDNYQTWQAGTIDLHRGRGQLIITAPEKPPFALIDLRAVRLIPPK